MKKILFFFLFSIFLGTNVFAADIVTDPNSPDFVGPPEASAPLNLQNSTSLQDSNNILGVSDADLRNGNVSFDTIPGVIVNIINVLLGVAGTISIVALIYYAIRMQASSGITGDASGVDKAKKGMYGALIGFVVAILAWFIVIRFVEILTSIA